ncbi:MAG: methyltransferase domain-containing protein [Acidobacteria bacterium]|nr:methyltransferase domain-containing protein [Acidobacteriota bacterium]MBI3664213.1 methyltransferase domain-containing protein [Acidobacteriota bacterium]
MSPLWNSPRDWFRWLLFEIGAGYYTEKLATGPEAELRAEFAEFLAPPCGARVLDVGCGPGHLARLLARRGCRVTGVDRGRRLLRLARRWAAQDPEAAARSIEFHRAPAERLPFSGGVFDLTLATTVVYFVAQPAAVLREMVRVTRPGGTVATLDPHASMNRRSVRDFCERRHLGPQDTRKLIAWAIASERCLRFEAHELRALLVAAGLEAIELDRRMAGLVWFARARKPAGP